MAGTYHPFKVIQNYYPFGMVMPGRSNSSSAYRFGFNGIEKDDEIKGSGNSYSFEYRVHDPRINRFLSVDPLTAKYPELSPYQFATNNPIRNIDLYGLEGTPPQTKKDGQNTSAVSSTYTARAIDPTKTKRTLEIVYQTPPNAISDLKNFLNTPGSLGTQEPQRIIALGLFNMVDDTKTYCSGFFSGPSTATNLEGIGVSPKEYANAGFNSFTLYGSLGLGVGENLFLRNAVSTTESAVSPNVKRVLNSFNEIKVEGGTVKLNRLDPTQELNMTVRKGTQKLDLRIETHTVPTKYGGDGVSPQRHMNVDLYPNRRTLPNSGHKILYDE